MEGWFLVASRGRVGESVFNPYKVSVMEDEKVLEMDSGNGWATV